MIVKYVVFETLGEHGLYMPIIFPEHIAHSQVQVLEAKAVSAGFYNISSGMAYGHSESLNLSSVPERDSNICQRAMMGMSTGFFMKHMFDEKSS